MRPLALATLEAAGAVLIVAGLALVALWAALLAAGGFCLLAARAADTPSPSRVRAVR